MANLHQLLKAMVEKGASDLHITTGSPPQLRIDGELVPLKTAPLSPVETKQLCYSILTDAQKHKFEEDNELDLSFGVKGLSRFRSNIFMQRGAVAGAFRMIQFKIVPMTELGLPPVIEKIATLAVREVPGVHEFATGETAGGEKPIAISLDGKSATIEIHLVIEYGFAVHSVTEKVRTKVISALENLFGLDVTAVDIVIDDIHLELAEPAVE